MPDYQQSKIYKITSNANGLTYYGSTVRTLSIRMKEHKKENKKRRCTSRLVLNGGDAQIQLIETFACNNKKELHAREAHHIRNNPCVNKLIPCRTDKEYRIDNKEMLFNLHRVWYEKNKTAVLARRSTVCDCICGNTYTTRHRARHNRTKHHLFFIL